MRKKTGGFWTDQMNNTDPICAYHKMAEEIWTQTNGQIDGFVQSVGQRWSFRGNAEGLRRHKKRIKIVAVEPAESPVLSGGEPALIKLMASEQVSSFRCGRKASPIRLKGFHRRSDGHGHSVGAGGRTFCWNLHRWQRHRGFAISRATGTGATIVTVDVRYAE